MPKPDGRTADTEARGPSASVDVVGGVAMLAVVAVFIGKSGDGYLDWLFPEVLAYSLGVLAVLLIVRGLAGVGMKVSLVPPLLRGEGVDVGVFTILVVVYAGLVRPVGFWVTSTLMIVLGSTYLDVDRSWRNILRSLLVAVVVCVVAWLIMTRVFFVPVPRARWVPW
jgi:hypothetical protein